MSYRFELRKSLTFDEIRQWFQCHFIHCYSLDRNCRIWFQAYMTTFSTRFSTNGHALESVYDMTLDWEANERIYLFGNIFVSNMLSTASAVEKKSTRAKAPVQQRNWLRRRTLFLRNLVGPLGLFSFREPLHGPAFPRNGCPLAAAPSPQSAIIWLHPPARRWTCLEFVWYVYSIIFVSICTLRSVRVINSRSLPTIMQERLFCTRSNFRIVWSKLTLYLRSHINANNRTRPKTTITQHDVMRRVSAGM